jgi:hypothetical protein
MTGDELKTTFSRVTAYRHVCEAVRQSANHTLLSGVFFLAIAGFYSQILGTTHPVFLVIAFLAVVEIGIGIWKKVAPSVECVLLDSITNLLFGLSVLVRQFLHFQKILPGEVHPFSLFIGCWALFDAYRSFSSYRTLRGIFVVRPTAAQMRYVKDMVADIRDANPASDETALDLASDPPVQAQMAGEYAFVLDGDSGDAVVIDRDDLTLVRQPGRNPGEYHGHLTLGRQRFDPFPLDESNWRNYCRWKGESTNS